MQAKESGDSKEYKTGGGNSLYILIICTLLHMVNYMDRQVLAAVVVPMKLALNLNDSHIGILCGICYFMAAKHYVDDMERVKGDQLMAEK